jgi:hypothetical protein
MVTAPQFQRSLTDPVRVGVRPIRYWSGLLRKVDAVTVRGRDLDSGLAFYRDALGHQLVWRNDEIGQAGLRLTTKAESPAWVSPADVSSA